MTRLLKSISIFVAVLVIAILVGFMMLSRYLSPTHFKPLLIEQVKKTTGRDLTINGDVTWSLFPSVGLKINRVTLNNPEGFSQKTFADVEQAVITVEFMPLLSGKIQSKGITLSGVKLNLIKNAAGKTNWQGLMPSNASSTDDTTPKSSSSSSMTKMRLTISKLDIEKVDVNWMDEQAKRTIAVHDLALHAKDINLNHAFPMSMEFDFVMNSPAVTGKLSLEGDLNLVHQQVQFQHGTFATSLRQGKDTYQAKGKMNIDLPEQTVTLTEMTMEGAGVNLTGQLNVTQLLTTPIVKGLFSSKTLRVGSLTIQNVQLKTQFQQGVLTLSPLTANFYQGTIQSNGTIDFNGTAPKISLQTDMNNVQMEPLLGDLSTTRKKITLKGAGNIHFAITSVGTNKDMIVRNLNGSGRLNVNNGIVEGIDVGFLVDTARALVDKQLPKFSNSNQTPFGTLTATMTIRNGEISNNDLLLDAPRMQAKGDGTVNLVSEQINYSLMVNVKQDVNRQKNDFWHAYGLTVPVRITGSLQNPSINVDTAAILKQAAEKQAKSMVKDQINKQIQNVVPQTIQKSLPPGAGQIINNLLGN